MAKDAHRQGCRKRWYPSQEAAEADMPMIETLNMSKPRSQRRKGKLHAYHCPKCEKWHVGHARTHKWVQKLMDSQQ